MPIVINVIVTCTKRKTLAVPKQLKFRCIRKAPIETKADLWCDRLIASRAETLPARQLYSGDHWSIARSMENASTNLGPSVRLRIASAGYGLVTMDTPLKPYSATFSSSHPDSIAKKTISDDRASIYRHWWEVMSRADNLQTGKPRTIAEIAADSPNAPLLVIASENYLLAIQHDLQTALSQLNSSDLLSIFSAGCKSLNGLADHLLPYDARMQHAVGGALRSLNMRVAQMALADCRRSLATFSALRQMLSRISRQQPELRKFERQPMTDTEVRRYIARELKRNSDVCHTPLLRKLRDGGQACEQKRFAKIFREVREREQLNGS